MLLVECRKNRRIMTTPQLRQGRIHSFILPASYQAPATCHQTPTPYSTLD